MRLPGAVMHSTLWEAFPHLPLPLGRVLEPFSVSTVGIVLGSNVFGHILTQEEEAEKRKDEVWAVVAWKAGPCIWMCPPHLFLFLQESRGLHSCILFIGTNSSHRPFRKERTGGDTLAVLYCSFSLWMMEFAVAGCLFTKWTSITLLT